MELDPIPISSFLDAVIGYLVPILLVALGGTVAFTVIRKGCKWSRRLS